MMELTELEAKLLRTIPKECFYENGFDLEEYEGIDQKQARGVLSSLSKKGYLAVESGKDGYFNLLEPAKRWLMENKIVDQDGYKIKA